MFSSALVASVLAVPFFAHTVFATACTRQYTVKQGDYCDLISAQNGVSTYQLAAINPEIDPLCGNLMPDQVLCLGTENEDCTQVHIVQLNDICESVADKYSINTTLLYHNNPQLDSDCTNLYDGEVVCVAGTFYDPVPANGAPTSPPPTQNDGDEECDEDTPTPAPTLPTTTVEPTSSPTPPPADPPTTGDDEEDEDCDEEEEEPSVTPTLPPSTTQEPTTPTPPPNNDTDSDSDGEECPPEDDEDY